jgi:hypothetical protein
MTPMKVNRRGQMRSPFKGGVFAISSRPPVLGEIKEMSTGGLSFTYLADDPHPLSLLELFSVDHEIKVRNLRIKTVWDSEIMRGKRNQGVRFLSLNPREQAILNALIRNYGYAY